jgi:hypothetical protein
VFNNKNVLFCRLFTVVGIRFVYDHLYRGWKITICLRKYVHGWSVQRE